MNFDTCDPGYGDGVNRCVVTNPVTKTGANTRGNWNTSFGFRSKHANGCNFCFADGHVQFVPQSIDHRTYNLLGCRDDGKPPGNY
jgi:prepilin-type processing-associated H-X9-DG protein